MERDRKSDSRHHRLPHTNNLPPPPPRYPADGSAPETRVPYLEPYSEGEDEDPASSKSRPSIPNEGPFRRRIETARREDGRSQQQDEVLLSFAADYTEQARLKGRSRRVETVPMPDGGHVLRNNNSNNNSNEQRTTTITIDYNNDSNSDSRSSSPDWGDDLDEIDPSDSASASDDDWSASVPVPPPPPERAFQRELSGYRVHSFSKLRTEHSGPDLQPYGPGLEDTSYQSRFPARNSSLEPPVTRVTVRKLVVTKPIHNPKLRHNINFDPELHFRPDRSEEERRRRQQKAEQYQASFRTPLKTTRPEDRFLPRRMGDTHRTIEEEVTPMGVEDIPYDEDRVPPYPAEVHRGDPYYSSGSFSKVKVAQRYRPKDVRYTEEVGRYDPG